VELEVRLFANLRDNYPKESKGVLTLSMPQGSTAAQLVRQLNIPKDLPLIILVNGRRQREDTLLNDGDRVGIFPPVGGG